MSICNLDKLQILKIFGLPARIPLFFDCSSDIQTLSATFFPVICCFFVIFMVHDLLLPSILLSHILYPAVITYQGKGYREK